MKNPEEEGSIEQGESLRPIKPDFEQIKATIGDVARGSDIHEFKNTFYALQMAWDMGENNGWSQETRSQFDKASGELIRLKIASEQKSI